MPWLWIYLIGFLISLRFCAQEFYHLPDSGKATDIKTYHNVLKSYFMGAIVSSIWPAWWGGYLVYVGVCLFQERKRKRQLPSWLRKLLVGNKALTYK